MFGIKNPLLLYSERCLRGLARVKKLKLIVLVRDPVEWALRAVLFFIGTSEVKWSDVLRVIVQ